MSKVLQGFSRGTKSLVTRLAKGIYFIRYIIIAFTIGYLHSNVVSLTKRLETYQKETEGNIDNIYEVATRADRLSAYAYQEIQRIDTRLNTLHAGQTVEIKIMDNNK